MIAQFHKPAPDLAGKAPSTQDWTDPVVNYLARYIQGQQKVTPIGSLDRCVLCAMAASSSLATAPLPDATALRRPAAPAETRRPTARPADDRFHREANRRSFRCDGCDSHTRNPLQGAFLPEMRRQAPADWEDLWLSGEDATWMCVDCWRSHLESIGASTTPTDLARHLGLPLFAVTTSRCPAEIADDRLLPGSRADGAPRVFHCDHCRAVLREGPEGCGGTFIHDRGGRHLWSYDSVRPVLAASGARMGLRRPSGRDWQPPPRVPDPAFPDAPCRVAAWERGLWDATWMCIDCRWLLRPSAGLAEGGYVRGFHSIPEDGATVGLPDGKGDEGPDGEGWPQGWTKGPWWQGTSLTMMGGPQCLWLRLS